MQTQEILRILRLPELGDLGQFFRSLSATTLDSGGARRSVIGSGPQLLTHYYDDARTMYQVFRRGLSISGNGPCLGFRKPNQPYQWLSYQEVADRAEFLGSGLLQHNCKACTDQFIGVFAQNRPEWIIAELACYTYSMVVVPLYDTLGPGAIRYIINTADISTVIVDKPQKAVLLLEHVERKETPGLKLIILMDPFEEALKERGQKCGVVIKSMQAVESCGKLIRLQVFTEEDGVQGLSFQSPSLRTDQHLCVNKKLLCASQEMPTWVTWNRSQVFGREKKELPIVATLGSSSNLFGKSYFLPMNMANSPEDAVDRSSNRTRNGLLCQMALWHLLSFRSPPDSQGTAWVAPGVCPSPTRQGLMQSSLGDTVSSSAHRSPATATCTLPCSGVPGHVGAPLPCNHIKLVDVEELNYWACKGEGEICVRGPNVFKGYLKDPDRTKEALDSDGWLHTGDIGKWLPAGTLKVIDRKKHIFKLAQGEYVAPEKIENIYIRSQPVAQIYVHGDSLKAFLVGIVVPDPEVMPSWAQKRGIEGTYADLCTSKDLKKAILEDMVRLGKESGLHSFEQVKAIHIHSDMFSVQNGLLTPTLKAKRPELREYFKKQIEELYSISM
ncbi:hypothetical protein EGM_15357 [Macaca fascicularis]|uniref:long-chain-fatty-acid--CoA ligase n=1 Tax=Macaca fascicularis TaxID=9541 RepID=G7P876_MACFA|nr:hypothetical protein EGM_15357 [Macaca fascicularis]